MSFHKKDFKSRFGAMGDEAEGVFESVYGDAKWVRYGLNRPPVSMSKMPAFVRYTPDYLCSDRLVEVQGVGKDRTFKLKLEKFSALVGWSHHMPVHIFVWDSHAKRYGSFDLHDLHQIVGEHGSFNAFHEGKAYIAVNVDALPVDWTAHDA